MQWPSPIFPCGQESDVAYLINKPLGNPQLQEETCLADSDLEKRYFFAACRHTACIPVGLITYTGMNLIIQVCECMMARSGPK